MIYKFLFWIYLIIASICIIVGSIGEISISSLDLFMIGFVCYHIAISINNTMLLERLLK